MLSFQDLTVKFQGLTAVSSLSLDVEKGQIHSIIGPNGAGKTTVFNCISRFYNPSSGGVYFEGKDLLLTLPHNIINAGISRSFQNVELFSSMTVLENLMTGLHAKTNQNFFKLMFNTGSIRKAEHQAKSKALDILEVLGLRDIAHEKVESLPYGHQKMIDIARATLCDPKLLLLDEPVAGMNSFETSALTKIIKDIRDEMNITILLIEHDMSLVMNISDQITVMNFGKKISEGVPEVVKNDPAVIEAYLGEESMHD